MPNDQLEQPAVGGHAVNHPAESPPARRKSLWIVLAVVAGALFSCGGLLAVPIVTSLVASATQRDDVEAVLHKFMRAMAAKDLYAADGLRSVGARREFPRERLHTLVEGPNQVLFEGYLAVHVEWLSVGQAVHTNPRMPQGQLARVRARADYVGGVQGLVTAVLEKEDGEWRIASVNVVVPPDKGHGMAPAPPTP